MKSRSACDLVQLPLVSDHEELWLQYNNLHNTIQNIILDWEYLNLKIDKVDIFFCLFHYYLSIRMGRYRMEISQSNTYTHIIGFQ